MPRPVALRGAAGDDGASLDAGCVGFPTRPAVARVASGEVIGSSRSAK